jgi:hypothetical protein
MLRIIGKAVFAVCLMVLPLASFAPATRAQAEVLPEFARDVLEVCLTAISSLERSYGIAQERGYIFVGDITYSPEFTAKRFTSQEKGMFEIALPSNEIVGPACLFEKKIRLETDQISVLVQALESDDRVPELKGQGKCEKPVVDGCRMIGYSDTTFPYMALLQPGEAGFHFSIMRLKVPTTN